MLPLRSILLLGLGIGVALVFLLAGPRKH